MRMVLVHLLRMNGRNRCVLVLLPLLVLVGLLLAPSPMARANLTRQPTAARVATHAVAIEPPLGYYSPNTTIERRGEELWFLRPPYASVLAPNGDGTFTFTSGWLAGRLVYFTHNETGGASIMLLADGGTWQEFARSGEIYADLSLALRGELAGRLERTIATTNVPGALLYVHIPGQGMWMAARGVSNRAVGIPMVPHDRVRVASVSKMFVAVVILKLAEEGVLSLDDTVEQWMPLLVPNGAQITIRQLLNHTSGIYDYLDNYIVSAYVRDRARIWSVHELVTYGVTRPTYFAPGEPGRWAYSNTNYLLLGMIIEHATGTSVAQQVRWRILDPLGMHNTFFEPYEPVPGGVVRGYLGSDDSTDINMSVAWAAGGMASTVEDLGRFAQALFEGRLLNPEPLAIMHEFVGANGAWGQPHINYGLGLMQNVLPAGHGPDGQPRHFSLGLVRGHTGALAGYRTSLWYMPETGVTIVVAANQMYYNPNALATEVMQVVLGHLGR